MSKAGSSKSNLIYDPDQDPEEKREVRKDYRKLNKRMEERQANINDVQIEELTKDVGAADDLFSRVKGPQDATLDSSALLLATTIGAQKARAMKSGTGGFDVDEFVSKLVSFMGGRNLDNMAEDEDDDDDDDADIPLNWSKLGLKVLSKSHRAPVLSFMLGPLSLEAKKRAPVQRSKLEKNKADQRAPQELKADDIERATNETTKNVAVLEKLLGDICDEQQDQNIEPVGVNLFKFIINPRDFAQSVENIFHLSFLIRDGKVALETNDQGEPWILACIPPSDEDYSNGLKKRQIVFEFDQAVWQRAIEVFDIKEPFVPQRPPAKTRLGNKWYG